MKIFSKLMDQVLGWSRHPKAPWFLGALSFAESSFFPIPPDIMLAPMVMARRERAWRLAALTTITSVLGGLAGFVIGIWFIEAITPWLQEFGYMDAYQHASDWFVAWGFWAVLAAGFSPIPYKIFTIAAGAAGMAIAPFALASLVGRASRFFLVAGLLYWGGERFEIMLRRYVDIIGWVFVGLIVIAYLILSN